MSQTAKPSAIDCIFENILGFMLPFFLSSAGGDADLARAAITELADAYNAATPTELELVGRVLGFSVVAMDNLRLSMNPGMSDTKTLRYRSNAVALSRAGEQCRKILEVVQANRNPAQHQVAIPHPTVPQPAVPRPAILPAPLQSTQPTSTQATPCFPFPADIEAMKRDARLMLSAFAQTDGQPAPSTVILPRIADPAGAIDAAIRAAIAAAKPAAAA